MCVYDCAFFLYTITIMTSNTNPLDWDYSSNRTAAGNPESEDQLIMPTCQFDCVFRAYVQSHVLAL